MADIRINALANTATSAASDDYLALDGSANGTRKILATNIANNVTDVILGSSGPSVKSTLSARAPRQGLVFDGTAGATATLGSAIGSGNTTYHVNFLCPSSAGIAGIIAVGDFSIQDSLVIQLDGSDRLALVLYTGGYLYSSYYIPSFTATYGGKRVTVSFTRNGTTINGFVNGISVSLTANNSGTPPAWNTSITTTSVLLGKLQSAAYYLNGVIYNALIYNRALSASEVVALYEAGAPAGADYAPQIAGTALLTGDSSTFTSGVGVWLGLNGGSIAASGGVGVISGMASVYDGVQTPNTSPSYLRKGYRYRLTVTTSAYVGGTYIAYGDGAGVTYGVLYAGTSTVEFTAQNSTTFIFFRGGGGCTSVSIDNVTLVPLGLLLAPDAGQAGGGLTWYDTSGNAANITLPASGVTWNVPTSGKMATSLNVNAAASLFASTSNSTSISDVDTTAAFITKGSGTPRLYFGNENAANRPFLQAGVGGGSLFMCIQPYGGNALFGSLTDSGNGKIQLATHTTSAGGIGFGTDTSLYRVAAGNLTLSTSTAGAGFSVTNSTNGGQITAQSAGTPMFVLSDTTQALNEKIWGIRSSSASFVIGAWTDSYSAISNAIKIDRSAGTPSLVTVTPDATFAGLVNSAAGFIARGTITIPSANYVSLETSAGVGYLTSYNGAGSAYLVMTYRASRHDFTNGGIRAASLPTSSAGLSAGDLWVDTAAGNVVKRV